MIGRCRDVDVTEAAPGLVLAADVPDGQGGVLLAKGARLTGQLLGALLRRGVTSVPVADAAAPAPAPGAACAHVAQRLAHLFRQPGTGDADALLRERIARYRLDGLE